MKIETSMINIYSTDRGLGKEVEQEAKMLQADAEKTFFYQMGIKKGEARGEKNTSLKNATIMVKKFKMNAQTIAKEFDIDYDELLRYTKHKR